ncbi:MAG: ECF-type sigma factor [Pseudomonadota bacterium]
MDNQVTQLLMQWKEGASEAPAQLWQLLHQELRQIANHHMHNQSPAHTLQATALVNEAFIKLVDVEFRGECRKEFLGLAAKAMRSILVDHARKGAREKRGGDVVHVTLTHVRNEEPSPEDILRIDELLQRLQGVDERMARVVELKVFGGLTYDEIASLLEVSSATVRSDMRFGQAWLRREMSA